MSKFIVFSIFIHIIFGALIISVSDQNILSYFVKNEETSNEKTQNTKKSEEESKDTQVSQKEPEQSPSKTTQKGKKPDIKQIKQTQDIQASKKENKESPSHITAQDDKDAQQLKTAEKNTPVSKEVKKDNLVSANQKSQKDLEEANSHPNLEKNIPVVREDTTTSPMVEKQKEDLPLEQQFSKHSIEQIIDEHPNLTTEQLVQDLKALENIDDNIPSNTQEDSPDSLTQMNPPTDMEDIPLPPSDEDIPLIPTEDELAQNLNKQTVPSLESPSQPPSQPDELKDKDVKQYTHLLQASGNPPISYPENARQQKLEGAVEVLYFVNDSGFVDQMKVLKSSGHRTLDDEALRTLSKHQYLPGQEGWYRHKVEFKLQTSQKISHRDSMKNTNM